MGRETVLGGVFLNLPIVAISVNRVTRRVLEFDVAWFLQ